MSVGIGAAAPAAEAAEAGVILAAWGATGVMQKTMGPRVKMAELGALLQSTLAQEAVEAVEAVEREEPARILATAGLGGTGARVF